MATGTEYEDLALHLEADVRHDFSPKYKGDIEFPYTEGESFGDKVDDFIENTIVKYFTDTTKNIDYISNYQARLKSRILFPVSDETDTFQASQAVTLIPSGNETVGIVHDAGKFITTTIGAQNVITFGSILDPAKKPISKNTKPIWYNPGNDAIQEIGLKQFGFDTDVIKSVTIKNLTAGTVSVIFTLGDDSQLDAITMSPVQQVLGKKRINDVEIGTAGFFTSIAKATDIELLSKVIKDKLRNKKYLLYVGKTLGDTFLVASCMEKLKDNDGIEVDNVYAQKIEENWFKWDVEGPSDSKPTKLMLKTGDRLNHIRAFIKGVGTVYETRKKTKDGEELAEESENENDSETKYFDYIPGEVSSEDIARGFVNAYINLIRDTEARYNELITGFKGFLDSSNVLKSDPMYSDFTGSETSMFSVTLGSPISKTHLSNAGLVIQDVILKLEGLKNAVKQIFNEKKVELETEIKGATTDENYDAIASNWATRYNEDVELATFLSPRTTSPLVAKGKYLHMNVVVAQGHPDSPITQPITITLKSAFEVVKKNRSGFLDINNSYDYKNTTFYKNFITPVNALIADIPSPDVPNGLAPLGVIKPPVVTPETVKAVSESFIEKVVKKTVSYLTHITNFFRGGPSKQKGGGGNPGAGDGSGMTNFSSSSSSFIIDQELMIFLNEINYTIYKKKSVENIIVPSIVNVDISAIKDRDMFPRLYTLYRYLEEPEVDELYAIYKLLEKSKEKLLYFADYTIAYQLYLELNSLFGDSMGIDTASVKTIDCYGYWKDLNKYMCKINHELSQTKSSVFSDMEIGFGLLSKETARNLEKLEILILAIERQQQLKKESEQKRRQGMQEERKQQQKENIYPEGSWKRDKTRRATPAYKKKVRERTFRRVEQNAGRRSLYRKFTHKTRRNRKND